jgi:hypothetical protein
VVGNDVRGRSRVSGQKNAKIPQVGKVNNDPCSYTFFNHVFNNGDKLFETRTADPEMRLKLFVGLPRYNPFNISNNS